MAAKERQVWDLKFTEHIVLIMKLSMMILLSMTMVKSWWDELVIITVGDQASKDPDYRSRPTAVNNEDDGGFRNCHWIWTKTLRLNLHLHMCFLKNVWFLKIHRFLSCRSYLKTSCWYCLRVKISKVSVTDGLKSPKNNYNKYLTFSVWDLWLLTWLRKISISCIWAIFGEFYLF